MCPLLAQVHPMSPISLEPEPDVRPHNMDYLAYFGGGAEQSPPDSEGLAIGDKACVTSVRHTSPQTSHLKTGTR